MYVLWLFSNNSNLLSIFILIMILQKVKKRIQSSYLSLFLLLYTHNLYDLQENNNLLTSYTHNCFMQRKLNSINANTHTRVSTQPAMPHQLIPTKNITQDEHLKSIQKIETTQQLSSSKEIVEQKSIFQTDKDQVFSFDMLEQLIDAIYFGEQTQQIRGLSGLTKLMMMPAAKKIIDKVVSRYLLSILFELAKHEHNSSIRKTAVDAIQSIMTINNHLRSIIIKRGALPLFIDHLKSNTQEQSMHKSCVKAMVGLITHSSQTRNTILKLGGLGCKIALAKQSNDQQLVNMCYEGLSLFLFIDVFQRPQQSRFEQLKETICILCSEVAAKKLKDQQIIETCIRTICYYGEGNVGCLDVALKTGFTYYLFGDILRRYKINTTHMFSQIIKFLMRVVQRANPHQISIILSQQLFGNPIVWESQCQVLEKYQILSLIATGGNLHVKQILNNRIIVNGLKASKHVVLKQKIRLLQTIAKFGQRKMVLNVYKQLTILYIAQIEKHNNFYQIVYLQYLRVLVITTLTLQSQEIYGLAKTLFDRLSTTGSLDKWKNSSYKRSNRTIVKLMRLFD